MTGVGQVIADGSLGLALLIALLAGVVSFASPCVMPIAPAYVSYVTGLVGADLTSASRGRVLAGTSLFVLGFSVVFVSFGALFGAVGAALLGHAGVITKVMGGVVILLGLTYLGLLSWGQRDIRLGHTPVQGLWGAPVLGLVFGLSWTPCIGPALAAVQTLAYDSESAARGAVLTAAYSLGLGIPFVLVGVGFRRWAGSVGWMRSHAEVIRRIGGGMLVGVGVLLVTGWWDAVAVQLRVMISGFTPVL